MKHYGPVLKVVSTTFALVMLFGLQTWTVDAAYHHVGHAYSSIAIVYAAIMMSSAVLQSFALLLLYRSIPQLQPKGIAVLIVISAVAMAALSLCAANTDIDAFAYVGYAKLHSFSAAYAPPRMHFAGNGFEAINVHWGARLPPLDYGPLWLVLDRLFIGQAPSYGTALLILRGVNLLLLGLLLWPLRRIGASWATIAVVALNPALYFYYIIEAHNDLLPILLVVTGLAIAQRRPFLGALVAGTAGLIKITFVLIATFAYAGKRSIRSTLATLGLLVMATVLLSALFGGIQYFHAIAGAGQVQATSRSDPLHIGVALHLCAAVTAATATIFAMFGIFVAPAAYSFSATSSILYPWYLGWCIPYALRMREAAPGFFIALPAITHIIDPHFSLYPARPFIGVDLYYIVVIALFSANIYSMLRRKYYSMNH